MKKATLDPAKDLTIYNRIDRDGLLTLLFYDEDGNPFLLDDYTLTWNFKLRSGDSTNIVQLTVANGGLVKSSNQLVMIMTAENAALFAVKTYFHELIRVHAVTGTKDWLTGDFEAHTGIFDGLSFEEDTITINEGTTVIEITISNGSGSGAIGNPFRGSFDPAAFPGLFPEPPDQTGSGLGGFIIAGDRWYSSGVGDLPDTAGNLFGLSPGTLIEALESVPGQDFSKWRLL